MKTFLGFAIVFFLFFGFSLLWIKGWDEDTKLYAKKEIEMMKDLIQGNYISRPSAIVYHDARTIRPLRQIATGEKYSSGHTYYLNKVERTK